MFETNVIVAPNSPSAFAKPMMSPASTPGSASGSVTVRKTHEGLAPSVAAAVLELAIDVLDAEAHGADDRAETP